MQWPFSAHVILVACICKCALCCVVPVCHRRRGVYSTLAHIPVNMEIPVIRALSYRGMANPRVCFDAMLSNCLHNPCWNVKTSVLSGVRGLTRISQQTEQGRIWLHFKIQFVNISFQRSLTEARKSTLAGRVLLRIKHCALHVDTAIVDTDFKKKRLVFLREPVFFGVIEDSEMCIDKQLNEVFLTF